MGSSAQGLAVLFTTIVTASGCLADRPTPAAPTPVRITAATAAPEETLEPVIAQPVVLANAKAWVLAVDGGLVYYGDAAEDVLRAAPKGGGPSTIIAGGAPWGIALLPGAIAWIAAPGTHVFRRTLPAVPGSPVDVLRGAGLYAGIASHGDDVYLAEVRGSGGAILRIGGGGTVSLANVDGEPRAIAVDDQHVFVQTDGGILRMARRGGEPTTLVRVLQVSRLAVDDGFVYTTALVGPTRALVRVPKTGGPLEVIERGVRDAPIALTRLEVLYLDADQPTLRRVVKTGGASRMVMRTPELWNVSAMTADDAGIYVASDIGEGTVLALPPLPPPRVAGR